MTKFVRSTVLLMTAGVMVCMAQPAGRGGGQPSGPPAGALSVRPSGASLGTIRLGAADQNIWFGWYVAIPGAAFRQLTFVEAAAKADAMGLGSILGSGGQKVALEIPKNLDPRLLPGERSAIVARLREYNVQMRGYKVDAIDAAESGQRALFQFAKDLGVGTIVTAAAPASLAAVDKLANEYGVNVAVESRNPKSVPAMDGLSKRVGVMADLNAWTQAEVKPMDGLGLVRGRLLGVTLRGRSTPPDFFVQAYRAGLKPLLVTIEAAGGVNTQAELTKSVESFETAMLPAMAARVDDMLNSPAGKIRGPDLVPEEMRRQIDAAAPRQALAKPRKARKLLVTDIQMYSGHSTIPHGNLMLELMAKYTGAFEPVFSNDLSNMKYPKIKEFDAVFLNNVCGMVFPHPDVRESLLRYVREGGGLGGNHAVTYANLNWPEFMDMIGAWAGAHHVEKQMLKIDDPSSPLTAMWDGVGIEHTDEFYHFPAWAPYTREKQHILMSIDVEKSDMATAGRICKDCTRPDHDYGVSWIKSYGKGRVYITPLGHTTILYTEPKWTKHILAAVQFILGDLDADTTPSAKLARKPK